MAEKRLAGKRVAILATDGFEQSELLKPQKALQDAGAEVHVVSLKLGLIKGWDKKDWGESVHVDMSLDDANPEDYDALMLPGGVINPDSLRSEAKPRPSSSCGPSRTRENPSRRFATVHKLWWKRVSSRGKR